MCNNDNWKLPRIDCVCHLDCPYKAGGVCNDPSNNKNNLDASCHKMSNKALLAFLQILRK